MARITKVINERQSKSNNNSLSICPNLYYVEESKLLGYTQYYYCTSIQKPIDRGFVGNVCKCKDHKNCVRFNGRTYSCNLGLK